MTGAPAESAWLRADPRRTLPPEMLERILDAALPGSRATEFEALTSGRRNANFKLRVSTSGVPMVLRLYEHDASICRKELDLLRLVRGKVPVPEVVYAAPDGLGDIPPFLIYEYVEGITFRELLRTGDPQAIAEAAFSAGEQLAAIARHQFPEGGWLGPGPAVTAPLLDGPDPMPRFLDLCLEHPRFVERVDAGLRARIHAFAWQHAADYAALDREHRLVHCDYNRRNLLVNSSGGKWRVEAVLDWEFAVSATPLIDVANFLRHESPQHPVAEPHFSEGYRHSGGELPDDWRRLSRWMDLTAVCESLTRGFVPEDVVAELVGMAQSTVA